MGYQIVPGPRRGGSFEHFKLTIGRNWLKGIVISWQCFERKPSTNETCTLSRQLSQIVAPSCGNRDPRQIAIAGATTTVKAQGFAPRQCLHLCIYMLLNCYDPLLFYSPILFPPAN